MATEKDKKSEGFQRLLSGGDLKPEELHGLVESLVESNPKSLPGLCQLLLNQRRAAETACRDLEGALAQLREPPWYPAEVLRVCPDGRVDVAVGGRRQVVTVAPGIDATTLHAGAEVLLSQTLAAVIARSEPPQRVGLVGKVATVEGGQVIVHGVGDEELVLMCNLELAATLQPGDRVVYTRDTHCVRARLAERESSAFTLARPPATTWSDIGGLDSITSRIRLLLKPHLVRPDVARSFSLSVPRGITLVGPPGTGKTHITRAIANHIAQARGDTRILYVRPGQLRGMYYGQSENNIRELFACARNAPGMVIVFFDELDSFGARGVGIGQDIDGRVLGRLLSELDGLDAAANVFCVAASNRLDLCDEALVRPGRLGDGIYTIPRPSREGAREIFGKYLTPELPYHGTGEGAAAAAACIEAAVAYVYAPQGGASALATVTFANGERHEVRAPAVMSGALIASAVERAKSAAACRVIDDGAGGLGVEDVLAALEEALVAEAKKLGSVAAARRVLDIPEADTVVRVETPTLRRPRRHRYLRAA